MTIDIEDELAAGMREFAGQLRLDNGVVTSVVRRHRRRRAVIRWSAAAGTLTVVAVVAFVYAGPPHPDPARDTAPAHVSPSLSPSRPQTLTVAYVREQVIEALNVVDEKVQHVTWREADSGLFRGESWGDHTTRATHFIVYHLNGAFDRETTDVLSGDQVHSLFVDYDTRTYRQDNHKATDGDVAAYSGNVTVNPTVIRTWMSDESRYGITIVGVEEVDGVNTVHLRVGSEDSESTLDENLWVDDTNYTIVRQVRTLGGIRFQADVNWLARTPENLALLTVVPPAGFVQVSE